MAHLTDQDETKSNEFEWRLHPVRQANQVGLFSTIALAGYLIACAATGQSMPPREFYVVVFVGYATLWASLWFAEDDATKQSAFRYWRSKWDHSSILNSQSRQKRAATPDAPVRPGFLERPIRREVGKRFPTSQALRVQLLAVFVICTAAWVTLYTGGPFTSPFSQVVLAYALLSPVVADRANSIAFAYVTTLGVSIGMELVGTRVVSSIADAPEWPLYAGTTGGILLVSGWLAWQDRRTD